MLSYWYILSLVVPMFALIGVGVAVRRIGWFTTEAEVGLLKLLVNILMPALVFKAVLGNTALRDPANLVWPPIVGFATMAGGIGVAYYVGRALGLHVGTGLRTFAFAAGVYNFAFMAIPIMEPLFGAANVGVLLVHNVGCELATWTVGLLMVSGLSLREGWRKVINPMAISLLIGVVVNATRVPVPGVVVNVVQALAVCAIPLGLIVCGATLSGFLDKPASLFEPRTTLGALLLRLLILPVLFLVLAKFAPFTTELKRVIVVQAAMPSAMMPLVIARHYGGQPEVAARIIIGTTLAGLFVIPWWLKFGLAWVGVG